MLRQPNVAVIFSASSRHGARRPAVKCAAIALLTLAIALAAGDGVTAGTVYWDSDTNASGNNSIGTNLGGSGTWDTSTLAWWNGTASYDQAWINSEYDTAVFTGATGTVTLNTAVNAGGLTFGVNGYAINGGGSLGLGSGTAGTQYASGSQVVNVTAAGNAATIATGVVLGSNTYLGGAGNLAINGTISDGGSHYGFTKFGSGTLTLGGTNTFSGPTTLLGGTTQISAAANLGGGAITFSGGTLQLTGSSASLLQNVNVGMGGGTIDTQAGELTLSGTLAPIAINGGTTLAGTTTITKVGTGTLTLGGTNTGSAVNTVVNAGTLGISGLGNLASGYLNLNNGTLQVNGTISAGTFPSIVLGSSTAGSAGTIAVALGQSVTENTAITGPGSLAVGTSGNTGKLVLSAAATYAGSTTVNYGTLAGGVNASLPATTSLTVSNGATVDMAAYTLSIASLSGSGTFINSGATKLLTLGNQAGSVNSTFSGKFTGTMTVTKNGGGTLTLNGPTSTDTGAWTLNAGSVTLDFSSDTATATNILTASIAPTLGGGTLTVNGKASSVVSQTLGAVTVAAGGSNIVMVDNGGSGESTTLTSGALTATAAGGALLVAAPANTSVKFNTAMNSGTTINGRTVFTAGTGAYDWAANGGAATPTVAYSGYTVVGTTLGNSTDTNNSAINSATASQTTNVSGGTWTTNSLKINAGGTGQSLSLSSNLVLTDGGLLFTGSNPYTISGSGILESGTATNSDLIINQYGSATLTISAPTGGVNGTATLTKAGTGTLVLTGTAAYTGATYIDGGTLSISAA